MPSRKSKSPTVEKAAFGRSDSHNVFLTKIEPIGKVSAPPAQVKDQPNIGLKPPAQSVGVSNEALMKLIEQNGQLIEQNGRLAEELKKAKKP